MGERLSRYGRVVLTSPNGRWLAFTQEHSRHFGDVTVLASADGSRVRVLGAGTPRGFSPDSRWLAVEHETADGESRSVVVVSTTTERVRRLGPGCPISFAPNGRHLAYARGYDCDQLGVIDLRTGQRLALGLYTAAERSVSVVGRSTGGANWSPQGTMLLFARGSNAFVVDLRRGSTPAQVCVRCDAKWLGPRRLAFERIAAAGRREIGVVTPRGVTTAVRPIAPSHHSLHWAPRGDLVSYMRPAAAPGRLVDVVVESVGGDRRYVLARAPITVDGCCLSWSPSGRKLIAVTRCEERSCNAVNVATAPSAWRPRFVRRVGWAIEGSPIWSPDERSVAFQHLRRRATEVAVVSLRSGRLHSVWRRGSADIVGWLSARLPGTARPPAPPRHEIATLRALRSSGRIVEIASEGRRVAAIVDRSARDCLHVLVWEPGTAALPRYPSTRQGCPDAWDFLGLRVRAGVVEWRSFVCGNSCYVLPYRWPLGGQADDTENEQVVERRPRPRTFTPETRRGVSVALHGRVVRVRRLADGTTRTIAAPRPVVDAELENAGLFYAYNTSGRRPGRIRFVPFAALIT